MYSATIKIILVTIFPLESYLMSVLLSAYFHTDLEICVPLRGLCFIQMNKFTGTTKTNFKSAAIVLETRTSCESSSGSLCFRVSSLTIVTKPFMSRSWGRTNNANSYIPAHDKPKITNRRTGNCKYLDFGIFMVFLYNNKNSFTML